VFKREWLRFWTRDALPEKWDKIILSWDMAYKEKPGSDYVVGQARTSSW
jgi:phage terminase large subunit-like protein